MINNPIIQREFVGLLRTGRALALQVCLIAALAVLVILRWPSDAQVDLSGQQAQQVLRIFGYGLLAGLMLLAPVFPATTVVREKQQGTLSLLLNSPMGRWEILLGKLLGVLGFVLLLLVLSLPAAAACFVMGGIDHWQVLRMYVVLFLVAIQYASLGLLVSSYASTSDSALRLTYSLILLIAVVTLGPYQLFHGLAWVSPVMASGMDWLRNLSPIPAMMEVLGHGGIASAGLMESGRSVERYAILAVVSTIFFLGWLGKRLNQRMFDRSRAAGRITDEQSAGVRAYRRIMYLWFFDPQRRSGLIGPLANPVMVKEFRSRRFGRGHWMMRLIGGCLIVSLGLMLAATRSTMDWNVQTLGGIMVLLQVGLIILLTPSLASGIISGERESGGWQLLQMTPLSAGTIVSGKVLSVAWTLLLLLLATVPGYVVLIAIDQSQVTRVMHVLLSLLLTAVFALLLSGAASSLFKRTAAATTAAYAVLIGLCAGTLLIWLGRDAPFSHHVVETALRVNPLAATLSLIEAPGFAQYRLVPANWWIIGGASVACLVVLMVQTWRLTRPR